MDDKDLGYVRRIGPLSTKLEEQIRSNRIQECARCHRPIAPDNDSGWEVFIDDGLTQPICISCNARFGEAVAKAEPAMAPGGGEEE